MANKLDMIRPCGGLAGAHLQYVSVEDSAGGVASYVVEYAQGTNVQHSLNWEFSQEKVNGIREELMSVLGKFANEQT